MDDWRSATEYHGYSASDAVIVWWWRALKSFSKADRAKVLSFATGTAKVPLGGFSELPVRFFGDFFWLIFTEVPQGMDGVQRFSIHKDPGPMNRLPQAHTCFNQSKSTLEPMRHFFLIYPRSRLAGVLLV